jgi:hypothetical protein
VKLIPSIATVGAAALIGTSAFVVPALASPASATHTLKFISVSKNSVPFSKTTIGFQDTDVNAKGKAIGFDEIYGMAVSATTSHSFAAIDVAGGLMYGSFTVNLKTGVFSNGKITGGVGAFKGVTGTFAAKSISNTKTAVTITYKG